MLSDEGRLRKDGMLAVMAHLRTAFAVLAAGLLALLLAGCGTSWLLMNDVRDFIDDSAPLQIWSGEVTRSDTMEAVPGAVVVLEAIPPEGAENEDLATTWCAVTDDIGYYQMNYRWRKGWSYTIRFSWYDEFTETTISDVRERGEVTWQDHEDKFEIEVAAATQL